MWIVSIWKYLLGLVLSRFLRFAVGSGYAIGQQGWRQQALVGHHAQMTGIDDPAHAATENIGL